MRCACVLACWVSALVALSSSVARPLAIAAEAELSPAAYASLPEADQRALLDLYLREWLDATGNIVVKSESRLCNVQFRNGQAVESEVVADLARYECELRRLAPDFFPQPSGFCAIRARSECIMTARQTGMHERVLRVCTPTKRTYNSIRVPLMSR